MFGSVLPASERIGVSTSSTPRSAKNARTNACRRARSSSAVRKRAPALMPATRSNAVPGKKVEQARLVPYVDAQFGGLVELGAGSLARDDEARLLRHAAGDLGAERLEFRLRLVPAQRGQGAGQDHGLAVERQLHDTALHISEGCLQAGETIERALQQIGIRGFTTPGDECRRGVGRKACIVQVTL